ncbi:MAG: ferrous iron transport protein B [Rhodospirillaceae bacterium]|nr:ferrous iron transport protein B [Rhodospirillaceae bacterium]
MSTLKPALSRHHVLVALSGQQNSGKSTIFNALTGARQHIANYPGVTVEKKSGRYGDSGLSVEVVDLPGAYSLTSFSLEERVARDFLTQERPDVIVNVVDAATLARGLPLTLQLLELGVPIIVALNMMDAAKRRGLTIDPLELEKRLGVPVIPTIGRRGIGIADLRAAIRRVAEAPTRPHMLVDYTVLEPFLHELSTSIEAQTSHSSSVPPRWLAGIALDSGNQNRAVDASLSQRANDIRQKFERENGISAADHIISCRSHLAKDITAAVTVSTHAGSVPLSERIDRLVLHRFAAPFFLLATIWTVYELAIVQGYELTKVTWPILASFRNWAADILPSAGFLWDPQIREIGLWMVDSVNTLLNYVPIFLILFALIAILEDSGYMARIAFILDRALCRFGLHGQSTLPLILAGVFAGGCAVPGVMATRAIPDTRARFATILIVPFMNCLAKIPLYTLLIGMFFTESKGLILFYLSTITVIAALLVSKLLTVTLLRGMDVAPFVMELPRYHLPTVRGVAVRAIERTWIYIKKVGTVVVAVAVVIYALLQYPGLSNERLTHFQAKGEDAIAAFAETIHGNRFTPAVSERSQLITALNVLTSYKSAKLNAGSREASKAIDAELALKHPDLTPFILRSKDAESRTAASALKALSDSRNDIRREMKNERLINSFLGRIGHALEPVTQFAGFDWRINVALLSSFAARESSVATLGVLFNQDDNEAARLEDRISSDAIANYTAVTAVAVMLFFALYPPCLATTIMVRVQTGSYAWMMFSILFPTFLGLFVASTVYTLSTVTGIDGLTAFTVTYLIGVVALFLVGIGIPRRRAIINPPSQAQTLEREG